MAPIKSSSIIVPSSIESGNPAAFPSVFVEQIQNAKGTPLEHIFQGVSPVNLQNSVYLSAGGNDLNDGSTEALSVSSFARAYTLSGNGSKWIVVTDASTIQVSGNQLDVRLVGLSGAKVVGSATLGGTWLVTDLGGGTDTIVLAANALVHALDQTRVKAIKTDNTASHTTTTFRTSLLSGDFSGEGSGQAYVGIMTLGGSFSTVPGLKIHGWVGTTEYGYDLAHNIGNFQIVAAQSATVKDLTITGTLTDNDLNTRLDQVAKNKAALAGLNHDDLSVPAGEFIPALAPVVLQDTASGARVFRAMDRDGSASFHRLGIYSATEQNANVNIPDAFLDRDFTRESHAQGAVAVAPGDAFNAVFYSIPATPAVHCFTIPNASLSADRAYKAAAKGSTDFFTVPSGIASMRFVWFTAYKGALVYSLTSNSNVYVIKIDFDTTTGAPTFGVKQHLGVTDSDSVRAIYDARRDLVYLSGINLGAKRAYFYSMDFNTTAATVSTGVVHSGSFSLGSYAQPWHGLVQHGDALYVFLPISATQFDAKRIPVNDNGTFGRAVGTAHIYYDTPIPNSHIPLTDWDVASDGTNAVILGKTNYTIQSVARSFAAIEFSLNGITITPTGEKSYDLFTGNKFGVCAEFSGASHTYEVVAVDGTSQQVEKSQIAPPFPAVSHRNPIGLARNDTSVGHLPNLATEGEGIDGFQGLHAGRMYYLQPDGRVDAVTSSYSLFRALNHSKGQVALYDRLDDVTNNTRNIAHLQLQLDSAQSHTAGLHAGALIHDLDPVIVAEDGQGGTLLYSAETRSSSQGITKRGLYSSAERTADSNALLDTNTDRNFDGSAEINGRSVLAIGQAAAAFFYYDTRNKAIYGSMAAATSLRSSEDGYRRDEFGAKAALALGGYVPSALGFIFTRDTAGILFYGSVGDTLRAVNVGFSGANGAPVFGSEIIFAGVSDAVTLRPFYDARAGLLALALYQTSSVHARLLRLDMDTKTGVLATAKILQSLSVSSSASAASRDSLGVIRVRGGLLLLTPTANSKGFARTSVEVTGGAFTKVTLLPGSTSFQIAGKATPFRGWTAATGNATSIAFVGYNDKQQDTRDFMTHIWLFELTAGLVATQQSTLVNYFSAAPLGNIENNRPRSYSIAYNNNTLGYEFAMVRREHALSSLLTTWKGQISAPILATTYSNLVGVSRGDQLAGALVDFWSNGAVVGGFTGLTTSAIYYVHADGTVNTTATAGAQVYKAISSTHTVIAVDY